MDLLDARELDADMVHGEAGDLGDLPVAEAFEQQRDDEAVLAGKLGDGGAEGGEPLLILEILVRSPAARSGRSGSGFGGLLLAAVEQGGIDGDAVQPGADGRLAAEAGRLFQTLIMISWNRSSTSAAVPR